MNKIFRRNLQLMFFVLSFLCTCSFSFAFCIAFIVDDSAQFGFIVIDSRD